MSNNIIEMQIAPSHGWRFGRLGGQVANFIMLLSPWPLLLENELKGCLRVEMLLMYYSCPDSSMLATEK